MINLSGQNSIIFDVRASRTGSHFKLGIHDSGGTTSEHAINIASANVWQEEHWDISGVSNVNKDIIDNIIITITNADAENIIYIDNIRTAVSLAGSTAGVSGSDGILSFAAEFIGSVAGSSGADGSLNINTELSGVTIGASGTEGILNVLTELGSSITEISGVGGALGLLDVLTTLSGSTAGTFGIEGALTGTWVNEGSATGVSGVEGALTGTWTFICSTIGTSGTEGILNVLTELGSSITETSGVGGALGLLDVLATLLGSTAGTSGADGFLNVATELSGFAAGTSGANGLETGIEFIFIGSTIGASGTEGILNVLTELGSSITETSGVGGALGLLDVLTTLSGSTAGTSGVNGRLGFWILVKGATVGGSDVLGLLDVLTPLIGSIVEPSGTEGILNISTELGSSITEISGVGGVLGLLDVLTLLVAPIGGTSGAEGFLNVDTELLGSAAGVSGADGSLNILKGLWSLYGATTGSSSLIGYLSVIPDFEAATLFWRPENNIIETLEWRTSILKAHDGTEQRIKTRQTPRQYFKLQLVLESNKINTWFDSVIHTWQKQAWLVPIWTEYVKHITNIDSHDAVIEVDTTNADFRNNNKAIIWKSATEYEVIVIDTKTDSQLNLSYSVLNSFVGDKYIIPVRTAYLISSSKKERYNSEISVVDLVFAVYDNAEISAYTPSMVYDGYEVLSEPAFMDMTHLEDSDGDIHIADFETGTFKVESNSNFNFLSQNHNFFNDAKSACWDFRKFLHSLNGRQKTILIPTFRDDVVQIDDIGTADISVKIENIKLAENMRFNSLRTYIGFYFPTEVLIVRKITAITEIDLDKEQITFNTNLGLLSVIEKGDCKICFVDKCRLASDKVEIQWPFAHRNECRTNFMRVYNG